MREKVRHHWELEVYKLSVSAAMQLFEASKSYPKEERYSLTGQMRDSSRSVSAQIAEGWRRRKYEAAFLNKLNEAEGEAAETQVWIELSVKCGYLNAGAGRDLHRTYNLIIGKLVKMTNNPDPWLLHKRPV